MPEDRPMRTVLSEKSIYSSKRCICILLRPLAFNVLFDCIQRRTANGHDEVARTPQVTAPKTILESRELLKQPSSRYAFQAVYELRDLLVRLHPHNDVNMVNFVLCCEYLHVRLFAKFFKQFAQPVAYLPCENRAAIFHAPNNVVLELMHRMGTALQVIFHASNYTTTNYQNAGKVLENRSISALQPIAASAPLRGLRLREIHPPRERRGLLSQEPIKTKITTPTMNRWSVFLEMSTNGRSITFRSSKGVSIGALLNVCYFRSK